MARIAVALVWLYQGLWCKVFLACPEHLDIVRAVPFVDERQARVGLRALGALETCIAIWILTGWRPYSAALIQTVLLVVMNAGGLIFGGAAIESPGALLTQNLAFLTLAWIAAGRASSIGSLHDVFRRGRLDSSSGPPAVLFGWSYEDPAIEMSLFPAGSRVFCIAAAGDTARALAARGDRVTAADVNPAQVDYARGRASGSPVRAGVAEHRMSAGRRLLPWFGVRERDLERFLALDDPEEQTAFWRAHIATFRLRTFLRVVLHPVFLRWLYPRELVEGLPRRFDRVLLARFERTWGRHGNRANRWAWRLLLDRDPSPDERGGSTASAPPEFVVADAQAYLAACPPATFDGITLSNLVDAVPAESTQQLIESARRAAKPGARIVIRTFSSPKDSNADAWAARDRSPLWGGIEILEVGADGRCAPIAPIAPGAPDAPDAP